MRNFKCGDVKSEGTLYTKMCSHFSAVSAVETVGTPAYCQGEERFMNRDPEHSVDQM